MVATTSDLAPRPFLPPIISFFIFELCSILARRSRLRHDSTAFKMLYTDIDACRHGYEMGIGVLSFRSTLTGSGDLSLPLPSGKATIVFLLDFRALLGNTWNTRPKEAQASIFSLLLN